MKSFRTEIEDPIVQKRHNRFRKKNCFIPRRKRIDDERFRSLVARGVYGQRQEGVQMILSNCLLVK
jgi:sulfite reductase (ferredoxin)